MAARERRKSEDLLGEPRHVGSSIDLFASVLSLKSKALNEDSSPVNTGAWDSVTNMMLVASIEDEFGIELTSDEIVQMTTIGNARAILQKRSVEVDLRAT